MAKRGETPGAPEHPRARPGRLPEDPPAQSMEGGDDDPNSSTMIDHTIDPQLFRGQAPRAFPIGQGISGADLGPDSGGATISAYQPVLGGFDAPRPPHQPDATLDTPNDPLPSWGDHTTSDRLEAARSTRTAGARIEPLSTAGELWPGEGSPLQNQTLADRPLPKRRIAPRPGEETVRGVVPARTEVGPRAATSASIRRRVSQAPPGSRGSEPATRAGSVTLSEPPAVEPVPRPRGLSASSEPARSNDPPRSTSHRPSVRPTHPPAEETVTVGLQRDLSAPVPVIGDPFPDRSGGYFPPFRPSTAPTILPGAMGSKAPAPADDRWPETAEDIAPLPASMSGGARPPGWGDEPRTASSAPSLRSDSLSESRTSLLSGLGSDASPPARAQSRTTSGDPPAGNASARRTSAPPPPRVAGNSAELWRPIAGGASPPPPSRAPRSAPPPGAEPFGNYLLLGKVGHGGMADVRLACQTGPRGFTKPCVIKRITDEYADLPDFRSMFLEEARISNILQHPNIVRLIEFDEVAGRPFMALELIDGVNLQTLDTLAGDQGLPLSVVLEIGARLADALSYAHMAKGSSGEPLNLVHRDISPQNVLISRDGKVKLADFGIARFEGRNHQTGIGPPKGKLRYMAPEVLRYEPPDQRADLFSLGVVLLESFTGRVLLPDGVLVIDDLEAHVRERCQSARAPLPEDLVELLVRLTARRKDDRPSHARDVLARLTAIREGVDDGDTLPDYAQREIAPRVPSAEGAVFALLGPGEGREAPAAPRAGGLGSAVIDLSSSLGLGDDLGFPTTALFVLSKELGLARNLASAPVVPTPWEDENLDSTHQTDDGQLPPGLAGVVKRDGSGLAQTYQHGPPSDLFPLDLPPSPTPMVVRSGSGVAATYIRPELDSGPPTTGQGASAPPGALSFPRGPIREVRAAPRPIEDAVIADSIPPPIPVTGGSLPATATLVSVGAPAPGRFNKRHVAMAVVVLAWLAGISYALFAILSR